MFYCDTSKLLAGPPLATSERVFSSSGQTLEKRRQWLRVGTGPELSDRSGPAGDRPFQKMFQTGKNRRKPAKTGRYFQAIYRWLKKVAPKNTRLRIFCRVFVSIDFCNNIS